jgi:hypothetical protein
VCKTLAWPNQFTWTWEIWAQITFFFPPPKSEYFFQQHWESEYFFRKKNITPPFKLNRPSLTQIYMTIHFEFLLYSLMFNSGKKINILTLVKKILNETKNHNPPCKLNGRPLMRYRFSLSCFYDLSMRFWICSDSVIFFIPPFKLNRPSLTQIYMTIHFPGLVQAL